MLGLVDEEEQFMVGTFTKPQAPSNFDKEIETFLTYTQESVVTFRPNVRTSTYGGMVW